MSYNETPPLKGNTIMDTQTKKALAGIAATVVIYVAANIAAKHASNYVFAKLGF